VERARGLSRRPRHPRRAPPPLPLPPTLPGFYSAVAENADTLWLCGFLSHVVRLTLSTGRHEVFETGAPRDLMFQGMRLDPPPASSSPTPASTPSPSTSARGDVRLHTACSTQLCSRHSFPNGDGTYSFVTHIPDEGLLRWDPRDETISSLVLHQPLDAEKVGGGTAYRLIEWEGRWYVPNAGWFNPARNAVDSDGPRPAREATWFGRRDHLAYGFNMESGWDASIVRWDLHTGAVTPVCVIPRRA